MYRVDLEHILRTYRLLVHPEMHRGTVFMAIVDLDVYHDAVLLVVFSRVPASFGFLFLAVARVLPCVSCLCW